MKQYRTPEWSEFKDGFVFEVYSEGYSVDDLEDLFGWYEYTYGEDNWRDDEQLQVLLEKGEIRVRDEDI